MSRETSQWLNTNTLIGFTDKRGKAWHYRASEQGAESNHYPGPIPIEDVKRRLFNWEAIESPVWVDSPIHEDEVIPVPGIKAIMRPDTCQVFGTFAEGYQIHQYGETLLQRTENILDAELQIGSAGLLRGGARAWVSVEIPDTIQTKSGVDFRPSLIACTSLDGKLATTWKEHATIVVCDNTMDMALSESGRVHKVRHTKNSLETISNAREALGIVFENTTEFEKEIEQLCRKRVTEKQWQAFLDVHIELPQEEGTGRTIRERKREEFEDLWRNDERVSPWKGTKFGVLQCANTWEHHLSRVKGGEEGRADKNMENALMDKTSRQDAQVLADLEKALALV